MRDCPHHEAFRAWHKDNLNSQGVGQKNRTPAPRDPCLELTTKVASFPEVPSTVETGPTMRWVGPETLVDVVLEGCEASALADSGSQVNMMMPEFVQEQGLSSLAIEWTCKLSIAFGRTGWLTHVPTRICDCQTSSSRGGRIR